MILFQDFWLQALKTDPKKLYNKKELSGGISGSQQQLEEQSWKCPRSKGIKGKKQTALCLIAKSQRKYTLHPSVKVSEEVLIGQP